MGCTQRVHTHIIAGSTPSSLRSSVWNLAKDRSSMLRRPRPSGSSSSTSRLFVVDLRSPPTADVLRFLTKARTLNCFSILTNPANHPIDFPYKSSPSLPISPIKSISIIKSGFNHTTEESSRTRRTTSFSTRKKQYRDWSRQK